MINQTIKTIIVDDEKPSQEALFNYIQEFCPDIEIVAQCASSQSAFKSIMEFKPQLVFLDIEMPKGNGFDLLRMLQTISFSIIFVTAFSDYAVQAFRFSASDFLLKPIKVYELMEAVNKVKQELAMKTSLHKIQTLLENITLPADAPRNLVIANSKGYNIIKTSDIIMCQADGYCTHFYQTGKSKISSSRNLKYYEELLPKEQFIRVHHSFIINIHHLKSYSFQNDIFLTDDLNCYLGSGYKQAFLRVFKNLK